MELALIVDFGTTNVKAGVVDPEGNVLAHSSRGVNHKHPEKGAVEHDPDELFNNFVELTREVSKDYSDDIAVIALSGYQFGFLPMDKAGKPLTGMITLLDTRTKSIMDKVEDEISIEKVYQKTGCPLLFTYILSRLFWLKEKKPDIFAKSAMYADIKSYLSYKLCGKFYTEPSIASVTQLYNIHEQKWDQEILSTVGIDESQLPEVVPGEKVADTISAEAAELLGLNEDVALLPGVYDGGAMIIGMGGYDNKLGVCNLGTTAMFRSCSTEALMDDPTQRRMQTYALTSDKYAIGGAINNAGISYQWFKEQLSKIEDYAEMDKQAEKIDPGSDGLFCLPFLTGERDPRIGNMASASFFGFKEYHTSGHATRSVLEGVGYALNMIKDALKDNGVILDTVMIGGSGSRSDLWVQMLADIFNTPVQRSLTQDSTLIGEAILAYNAIDTFDSIEKASQAMVKTGDIFKPNKENVQVYEKSYSFFLKLVENFNKLYSVHTQKFSE